MSRTEAQDALVPVEEAARRLGVSDEWVRRAARERRIASVKIGSRVLFRPEDVQAYIDAHLREPVEA